MHTPRCPGRPDHRRRQEYTRRYPGHTVRHDRMSSPHRRRTIHHSRRGHTSCRHTGKRMGQVSFSSCGDASSLPRGDAPWGDHERLRSHEHYRVACLVWPRHPRWVTGARRVQPGSQTRRCAGCSMNRGIGQAYRSYSDPWSAPWRARLANASAVSLQVGRNATQGEFSPYAPAVVRAHSERVHTDPLPSPPESAASWIPIPSGSFAA